MIWLQELDSLLYMFPKPGEIKPSQKWSYVKAVNIDGTPGIIGAGFYPE
jgi:hypothetical protein